MRLYYGGYGHHPSGKQYVYLGDDNYRTGQNVVVPVRQWKSGKLYNTMFTIQRTSDVNSKMSINEMQRLTSQGTAISFIKNSNVMSLPGASDWKSAKQWKEWSNLVYEEEIKNRLKKYSNKKPDVSMSNTELEYYKVDKTQENEAIKEVKKARLKGDIKKKDTNSARNRILGY